MRFGAAIIFAGGILVAVRVMFFGVRRTRGSRVVDRAIVLSFGAMLLTAGAALYMRASNGLPLTTPGIVTVLLVAFIAGGAGWWIVRASAAAAATNTDPDDDARYRYQGYVARVVTAIRDGADTGRIAIVVDGQRLEFTAKWLPGTSATTSGSVDSEVVIEHVDGDVAFVEPWELVEGRL